MLPTNPGRAGRKGDCSGPGALSLGDPPASGTTLEDREFATTWTWLVRVVRGWVGCWQRANDISSVAIARAWRRFGDSIRWPRMRPWLITAARRLAINDRLRRPPDAGDGQAHLCADPRLSSYAERQRLRDVLQMTRQRLSESDRTTMGMMELGAAAAEIGAARGVTSRAAQLSMARVRRTLADVLSQE